MTPATPSRTVLAVGAHPDDIELGAGATLLRLSKAGWRVVLLVVTDGRGGGRPSTRREEQQEVARQLEAELHWGNLEDGCLRDTPELIDLIGGHIRRTQPQ